MKWIMGLVMTLLCLCCLHISAALSKKLSGKYKDCWERWNAGEKNPGFKVLRPNGTYPVKLYCNHTESGTATVIQRRVDDSLTFYRHIKDYQVGFQNSVGNYWAGLETIHYLTAGKNTRLDIHMADWAGNNRIASYKYFEVMDRTRYYQMFVRGFSGNVVDDMAHSDGMYFYTPDRPDQYNCAVNMQAGWWFNYCTYALPNGQYYNYGPYTPKSGYYNGIFWKDWMGFGYSLKFISMSVY